MNTANQHRLVWGVIVFWTAIIGTLAIIGAQSLVEEPECPSVWEAAKTERAGQR